MAKLQRKLEEKQMKFLKENVGKTFPSFKYLTTELWGKPYYNEVCRLADMKRLSQVCDIEYRKDTWKVTLVGMK